MKLKELIERSKRLPLDDDKPDGYLESDRDWMERNRDLVKHAVNMLPKLVEALEGMTQEKGAGYQEWQAAKAILEKASNIPTA